MSGNPAEESAADLGLCDREPIHLAGAIQPHGFLLAVDEAGGTIVAASENLAEMIGREAREALGRDLDAVLGGELARAIRAAAVDPQFSKRAIFIDRWVADGTKPGRAFIVLGHRHAGHVVVEGELLPPEESFDPAGAMPQIEDLLRQVEAVGGVEELLRLTARETRRLTGFDRVLVYRFDPDWHGRVVAEDRNEVLPSYLDLHFPASDIPRQARDLYRLNRLRLIARADYEPVRLIGASGEDARLLDLSLSTLRSVSPVHREYMRNMGTGASFSISLIREGRLWGLVSCHNREPRSVPFGVRTACALLGQVLSLQLSVREQAEALTHRMRLQATLTPMVATLAAHERLAEGIAACRDDLLRLVAADGAAVIEQDEVAIYGSAPDAAGVHALAEWLESRGGDQLVAISALGDEFPPARDYAKEASGVLAISASRRGRSWVFWFRREVVEAVTWGGDPHKTASPDAAGASVRLHPRKSFERWREHVRGRSRPWLGPEIEVAREFRVAVVDIVLRGAERMAQLNEELARTNRELENFSYTVSHDLRAPFRHIRGYAELLKAEKSAQLDAEGRQFLDYVLEGAGYAGRLVDNILGFSRMGRAVLAMTTVELGEMVREVIRCLKVDASRRVVWEIGPLPRVEADPGMLFRVMQNLLENAVKFTRPRESARIEVWAEENATEHVVHVRDNGVGFDGTYAGKLFGMFQRLHAWEEFEGSGIGLASVRRIVGRHGGRAWAAGRVDEGATFSFSLPKVPSPTNPLYA